MSCSRRDCSSCWRERRPQGGFTVVELLVVIALVALLTGLLLPALHTAKGKAAMLQCQSHLRSLGAAVRMYADQHGGRFPMVTDCNQTPLQVRRRLEPYVGEPKVFLCPRDPAQPTPPGGSYDWLVRNDPTTSLAGKSLDVLRHLSALAMGGDRLSGWHKPKTINVVYGDGHVEQISEQAWMDILLSRLR